MPAYELTVSVFGENFTTDGLPGRELVVSSKRERCRRRSFRVAPVGNDRLRNEAVWDSRSGKHGLGNGIFLLWMIRGGYGEWFWNRSTKSRMQKASPATLIEAEPSSIGCSGR